LGIITVAADILRSESRTFVPAIGATTTSGWTMRDALLSAAGCDRTAGHLTYWEWRELQDLLAATRRRVHPHTGAPATIDAEQWSNQAGRTIEEVLAALDAAGSEGDIEAPAQLTMRPWCNPKIIRTCRIPFIPLAAIVQAWAAHEGTWQDIAARYDLTPSTTPWAMLEIIDPDIRNIAATNVHEGASTLRAWMEQQTDIASPVKWMFSVCSEDTKLAALLDLAEQSTA
jgi:hypothetical protein